MTATHQLKVFVRGLEIQAQIGLYPHERGRTQPLVIDIELTLKPGPVHSIRDTVNYETLAARARDLAAQGHIDLVETFAETLAKACLQSVGAVSVRVRVEKPQALEGARAAGVEVSCDDAGAATVGRRQADRIPR